MSEQRRLIQESSVNIRRRVLYSDFRKEANQPVGGDILKFLPHFVFHSGSDVITRPTFTHDFSALVKSFQLR